MPPAHAHMPCCCTTVTQGFLKNWKTQPNIDIQLSNLENWKRLLPKQNYQKFLLRCGWNNCTYNQSGRATTWNRPLLVASFKSSTQPNKLIRQLIVFKSPDKYINSIKTILSKTNPYCNIKICFMWNSRSPLLAAILFRMSKSTFS